MDAVSKMMIDAFKEGCITVITEFKNKATIPDLPIMFANEGIHETFQESINGIVYQVATINGIDEATKTELIGNLTKHGARMVHAQVSNNEKAFVKEGTLLLEALNKLLNTGSWFKTGADQFAAIEDLQSAVEDKAAAEKFAPMILLMEVARALSAEEEYNAATQSECDEEDCDDCDDECQDE